MNNKYFELIFHSTQDALFMMEERSGQFYYIRNNQNHELLTGFCTQDLYNHTPQEILGSKDGRRLVFQAKKCLELNETVTFEETITFNQQALMLQTKLTPVFLPDGSHFIIGSRVDISWMKEAMDQADAQIHKFTEMFEKHTAIMLLMEPLSGRIVDANTSACNFYGYTIDELKSMSIHDINMMPAKELYYLRMNVLKKEQKYFFFPHKRKDGQICMVDVYSSPITLMDKPFLYSIIFDVTEREIQRSELYREKEFLKITLTSIGDGVIAMDTNGIITQANRAALHILKQSFDDLVNLPFYEQIPLFTSKQNIALPDVVAQVIKSSTTLEFNDNLYLRDSNQNSIPISCTITPIMNENRTTYGAVMVFRDISAESERKQHILYLSYHDNLTGLYNRRYFDDMISTIDRPSSFPLAIIMGDVNGLKITNDVFGHEMGDQLLKSIADVILEHTASTDLPIRWGGDEFVIFMPHTNASEASIFVDKIQSLLREKKIHQIVQMSISFGIAIKETNEDTIEELLNKAEELMYKKKLLESKSLRNSIIHSVLASLDERSLETKEHSQRLEYYCSELAKSLELTLDEMDSLSLLSVLHDIGMIGVDPHILNKAGPLNEVEWIEIRKHSEIGYRIAQSIPELSSIANHILYHHERWDGSGYPGGLSGESIPLLCRILAVADAFDAMVHDRIYRKAISVDDAVSEILENSGTQFDPKIVSAFYQLYQARELRSP